MTSRLSYASSPESDLELSPAPPIPGALGPPARLKSSSDPSIATQDDTTAPPPYTSSYQVITHALKFIVSLVMRGRVEILRSLRDLIEVLVWMRWFGFPDEIFRIGTWSGSELSDHVQFWIRVSGSDANWSWSDPGPDCVIRYWSGISFGLENLEIASYPKLV